MSIGKDIGGRCQLFAHASFYRVASLDGRAQIFDAHAAGQTPRLRLSSRNPKPARPLQCPSLLS